jgi:hypothetical protein
LSVTLTEDVCGISPVGAEFCSRVVTGGREASTSPEGLDDVAPLLDSRRCL